MIENLTIRNFKSVQNLSMSLGRLTVFIGENGAGKSNILEAISLASAAADDKLDNEYLSARGIRVSRPKLMKSAFDSLNMDKKIHIEFNLSPNIHKELELPEKFSFSIQTSGKDFTEWGYDTNLNDSSVVEKAFKANIFPKIADDIANDILKNIRSKINSSELKQMESNFVVQESSSDVEAIHKSDIIKYLSEERYYEFIKKNIISSISFDPIESASEEPKENSDSISLGTIAVDKRSLIPDSIKNFLIYSPEYTSLRLFEKEGQIEPLGINGEGLFKLVKSLYYDTETGEKGEKASELNQLLEIFGWFDELSVPQKTILKEKTLEIKDIFLDEAIGFLDQKSSNEGFLFVLFYFCLFISDKTPQFFAIDNIDASLNPKLCRELVKKLYYLSKKYNKKVILTTHNPAILDGIDINDEEQKLYVIQRNTKGHTTANLVKKKSNESKNIKLSEAFMRGFLGGLPNSF